MTKEAKVCFIYCLFVQVIYGSEETDKYFVPSNETARGHGQYEGIRDKLYDLCLYEGFCITQINCNCDNLCHVFDDCCIDNIRDPPPKSTSIWSMRQQFSCYGEHRYETGQHCWVISKCSPEWPLNDVKNKCETPDLSNLNEITPVYSDGYHYRNKFCAICNMVTPEIYWDVLLNIESCDIFQIYRSTNKVALGDAINNMRSEKGCNFFFQPPSEHPCRRCYPGIVSSSSVSQVCDENCRLYTHAVFLFGSFYKNIICYLCEYGEKSLRQLSMNYCIDNKNKFLDGSTVENGLEFNVSFQWSVKLRLPENFLTVEKSEEETTDCMEDVCTNVKCQNNELNDGVRCVDPFTEFRNVVLLEEVIECDANDNISKYLSASLEAYHTENTNSSEMEPGIRNGSDPFRLFRWDITEIYGNSSGTGTKTFFIVRVLYTLGEDKEMVIKWPWEELCENVATTRTLFITPWLYLFAIVIYLRI